MATDPNFENVTLLLHGDGTNGAQNNTFVDGSTNNFTITRNGNTTQGTFSPYGDNWSNSFDGTDDYLSIADNANLRAGAGAFTIEAWIYRAATGAAHTIYAKGGASTGIVFQVTSGNVLRFTHTTTNIDSTGTIGLATWTHVAVVREGTGSNETKLYINGTQDGAGTVSTDFTQTEEVRIGTDRGATADFNGYISNLRFVKGTAVYTAAFTVPTTPLTAISNTQLLTCKSNRFRDESSNAFTVTRNNNCTVQRFSPFSPTVAYAAGTIGGSGYFDGTDDYLSVADSANLRPGAGAFTIEAWIYRNASGAAHTIYAKGGASTGVVFGVTSGNVLRFTHTTTNIDSTGTVVASSWNHVAVVREGTGTNQTKLYINGTQDGQGTVSTDFTQTEEARIGTDRGATADQNGYLSDVRFVKGAAVYTATFTPPSSPLTAISDTQLLCNFTNAGILDNAMMAVPETVGNAQIDTTTKKYGTGSIKFDGTGDYLTLPARENFAFGTGDFTVEMWLNFSNGVADNFYLIDARNASQTTNWAIFRGSNAGSPQNALNWYTGATVYSNSSAFTTTATWTHIAYARQGTSLRLFVNGTLTDTFTDSTNYSTVATISYIGSRYSATEQLNGYIDDLRITKGVARYTANFTAPTAAFPDL